MKRTIQISFLSVLISLAAAVCLSLDVQAGEKREQTFVKTNFRTAYKTALPVGDVPNHEVTQEASLADIKLTNPDFKIKEEWTFIQADTVDGSGTHRGHFFDNHDDGSTTYGAFEGKVKTTAKADGSWESIWEGTYHYIGGSGKFKNIKGNGTYKGKASSKEPTREEGKETVEY